MFLLLPFRVRVSYAYGNLVGSLQVFLCVGPFIFSLGDLGATHLQARFFSQGSYVQTFLSQFLQKLDLMAGYTLFRRTLRMLSPWEECSLELRVGGPTPSSTAWIAGGLGALFGFLYGVLSRDLKVYRPTFRLLPTFLGLSFSFQVRLTIRMCLGLLIWKLMGLFGLFLKTWFSCQNEKRKELYGERESSY